jgi:hypothetical protein
MNKLFYVINRNTRIVEHEGSRNSCEQWIENVRFMFNRSTKFTIVEGSAERKKIAGY